MKVLFLVRALVHEGAERQLVLLANELARRKHDVAIAVFYADGSLEKEVDNPPVRIIPLGKRSRWDLLSFYWTVLRLVKKECPDVLHGWMSTPNLVATMARIFFPKVRVFWCIRCSNLEVLSDRLARIIYWFERKLSRFADCIVVNSQAGFDYAVARRFSSDKMICIPNGIDIERLRPDAAAGQAVRAEWGITGAERTIGLVGRLDPVKAHAVFLQAAAQLARERSDVRFICIGNGPQGYREKLQALSRRLAVEKRVVWLPARPDVKAVYNALDVLCLPSISEGFPNVVAEAMACGRHCVVTDVGDTRFLVGDAGIVVPPGDASALAKGLRQALSKASSSNEQGRQRILERFSLTRLADRTEEVLLRFGSNPQKQFTGLAEPITGGSST